MHVTATWVVPKQPPRFLAHSIWYTRRLLAVHQFAQERSRLEDRSGALVRHRHRHSLTLTHACRNSGPARYAIGAIDRCALATPALTAADCGMDSSHPPRVVVDPEIMWGTPCLAGSRLPARTLLDMVDGGDARERVLASWPWLTPAHVDAARAWFADSKENS